MGVSGNVKIGKPHVCTFLTLSFSNSIILRELDVIFPPKLDVCMGKAYVKFERNSVDMVLSLACHYHKIRQVRGRNSIVRLLLLFQAVTWYALVQSLTCLLARNVWVRQNVSKAPFVQSMLFLHFCESSCLKASFCRSH